MKLKYLSEMKTGVVETYINISRPAALLSIRKKLWDNRIFKIACGSGTFDTHWTEVLMREAGRFMDGLSLHWYTLPTGNWSDKGSATEFGEDQWFSTMKNTLVMDKLIRTHATIMDKYDPEKKVAMIVDEWGTWCNVEPGTNPGFLFQQNTVRDALVAGINLNIFNSHCDRVQMANIAQMVNVLQAIILTEGEKMVLTPTYHVFDMYKEHMDNKLLQSGFKGSEPRYCFGEDSVPAVSMSASMSEESGQIFITICNLDPNSSQNVEIEIRGAAGLLSEAEGTVLTGGSMNDHNTFDMPDKVTPKAMSRMPVKDNVLKVTLPPMSVSAIKVNNGAQEKSITGTGEVRSPVPEQSVNRSHEQECPLPADGINASMPRSGQNNILDFQVHANGWNTDEHNCGKRTGNKNGTG